MQTDKKKRLISKSFQGLAIWHSKVDSFENIIKKHNCNPASSISAACLPTDATTWLQVSYKQAVLSICFSTPDLLFRVRLSRDFAKLVPCQLKFWMTSPVLSCRRWANSTFKSVSNLRDHLTMNPLGFFLEIFPTVIPTQQPALVPQRPKIAILKDPTPVQQAVQVKTHSCLWPKRKPHFLQGVYPWSQKVLTSDLHLHQKKTC